MDQTTTLQSGDKPAAREPVVGVIYNPRSHRNQGRDLEIAARSNVYVEQPQTRKDIGRALENLSAKGVEFLIVNGGDGTVRDVLTCGLEVFGEDWPALAVLPKGKTNALNVDLGAPNGWSLPGAIAAYQNGQRIRRRPLAVSPVDGTTSARQDHDHCSDTMLGFILGGGAFTLGIQTGQDAHRLGAFNSLAVAAASVWGVAQALFGNDKNIWRRGTPTKFLIGADRHELPHSGRGDLTRRSVFLSSTLERFPAGMKLFGTAHSGLKLSVLDRPHRRILAVMPLMLAGFVPQWVRRLGWHQVQTDTYEMEIADQYILDGEAYPAGRYRIELGPELSFVVP